MAQTGCPGRSRVPAGGDRGPPGEGQGPQERGEGGGGPDDGAGSRAGVPRESPEGEGRLGDTLLPPAGARGWRRSTATLAWETVIQSHGQPCDHENPRGGRERGTTGSLGPSPTRGPATAEETPRRNQGGARAPAGGPEGEGEVGTWGSRALGLSQTMVIRER